jgi:hypothetical protein
MDSVGMGILSRGMNLISEAPQSGGDLFVGEVMKINVAPQVPSLDAPEQFNALAGPIPIADGPSRPGINRLLPTVGSRSGFKPREQPPTRYGVPIAACRKI